MSTAQAATIANDSPFCEARQKMTKVEDDLTSEEAMNAPLDEIERMLRMQGREMMRAMMQAPFDGVIVVLLGIVSGNSSWSRRRSRHAA